MNCSGGRGFDGGSAISEKNSWNRCCSCCNPSASIFDHHALGRSAQQIQLEYRSHQMTALSGSLPRQGSGTKEFGTEACDLLVDRHVVVGRKQAKQIIGVRGIGSVIAVGKVSGEDHRKRTRGVLSISGGVAKPGAVLCQLREVREAGRVDLAICIKQRRTG